MSVFKVAITYKAKCYSSFFVQCDLIAEIKCRFSRSIHQSDTSSCTHGNINILEVGDQLNQELSMDQGLPSVPEFDLDRLQIKNSPMIQKYLLPRVLNYQVSNSEVPNIEELFAKKADDLGFIGQNFLKYYLFYLYPYDVLRVLLGFLNKYTSRIDVDNGEKQDHDRYLHHLYNVEVEFVLIQIQFFEQDLCVLCNKNINLI